MDYGELLRASWRVMWRHKYLWLLGLFATESGCSIYSGTPSYSTDGGTLSLEGQEAADWLVHNWPLLLLIAFGMVVLALIFWVISLIATGGLIAGSDSAHSHAADAGLGKSWASGTRSFWRLLGMNLLLFAIGLAIFVLLGLLIGLPLGLAIARGSDPGPGWIIALVLGAVGLAFIAIPIAVVVSIVLNWARRSLVLQGTGPARALREGWNVFRANVGSSLLVWLVSVGLSMGLGIALLVPLAFLAIPAGLLFVGIITDGIGGAAWGLLALVGLIGVVVMSLVKAAFTTFFTAYWTIAYRNLVPASAGGSGVAHAQPGPPPPAIWPQPTFTQPPRPPQAPQTQQPPKAPQWPPPPPPASGGAPPPPPLPEHQGPPAG